jgi:hypothetical protein
MGIWAGCEHGLCQCQLAVLLRSKATARGVGLIYSKETNEDTAACFDDLPRVACPTCATTYGLLSGKAGPPFRRTGLAGFVANLAKSATTDNSMKGAKVYTITRKEDGRLYCRERVGSSSLIGNGSSTCAALLWKRVNRQSLLQRTCH